MRKTCGDNTKLKNWVAIGLVVLVPGVLGCNKDSASLTAPTLMPTVPPAGTIFMKGTVSDTAYRHIPGARVEVLDGPQAGLTATADARGEFSMTGLFDETTRFRASVDGHIASTRTLQPFCVRCNPNWWINFTLDVPDAPINVGDDYTLTFMANNRCTSCLTTCDRARSRRPFPRRHQRCPRSLLPSRRATFFEDWDAIGIGVAG